MTENRESEPDLTQTAQRDSEPTFSMQDDVVATSVIGGDATTRLEPVETPPTGGDATTRLEPSEIRTADPLAAALLQEQSAPRGDEAYRAWSADPARTPSSAPATRVPTGPRVGTIVWGLILALIGVGAVAVGAGVQLDLQAALIALLVVAGISLLVGAIATSARQRESDEAGR
ncbi:MAG: hypothetical protein JJE50_11395 [Actinomycetales bacterium]|nr:hypothetical protein [Actinomycetales bacterium]